LALSLGLISSAFAAGSHKQTGFKCDGGAFASNADCAAAAAGEATEPFNFSVVNTASYTVSTVWLRARLAGADDWTQIGKQTSNVEKSKGVLFGFDADWLADKLDTDVATLQSKGFQVRAKIESEGTGGGREDKCPTAEVQYVASKDQWQWREKSAGGDWNLAAKGYVYVTDAGGSSNSVKCKYYSDT
jgi:hypothetical protein